MARCSGRCTSTDNKFQQKSKNSMALPAERKGQWKARHPKRRRPRLHRRTVAHLSKQIVGLWSSWARRRVSRDLRSVNVYATRMTQKEARANQRTSETFSSVIRVTTIKVLTEWCFPSRFDLHFEWFTMSVRHCDYFSPSFSFLVPRFEFRLQFARNQALPLQYIGYPFISMWLLSTCNIENWIW